MNNFLIVKFVKYLFTLHEGDECGKDHGYPVFVKSESGETWAPILVLVNYVYGQILWLPWVFVCSSGYNTNIIGLLEPSPDLEVSGLHGHMPKNPLWFRILWIAMLVSYWGFCWRMDHIPSKCPERLWGGPFFSLSLSLYPVICRYPHLFVCVHMSVHLSCVHTSVGNEPKAWCKRSQHATRQATPLVQFFFKFESRPRQGREAHGYSNSQYFHFETSSHVSEARPSLLYRLRPASSSHTPATLPWPQVLPPRLIYLVPSIQPMASFLPSRHSLEWATSSDFRCCFHFLR